MIDWFVSKIGLLAFILVSIAALITFASMQLNVFDQSLKIQAANDLARMADSMCENCSLEYSFDRSWEISVTQDSVSVNGVDRGLFTPASPASFSASKVVISKSGGVVSVRKA